MWTASGERVGGRMVEPVRRTERMARRGEGSRSIRMALLASRAEGNRSERREEKNGETEERVEAEVVMISPDTLSETKSAAIAGNRGGVLRVARGVWIPVWSNWSCLEVMMWVCGCGCGWFDVV